MGLVFASPISGAQQSEISKKVQDIVTAFGSKFSVAYIQAVIEKAKKNIDGSGDSGDGLKLQEVEPPSQILHSGILTKCGDIFKTWHARFFIVYNEKDNYRIDYHEGAASGGHLKGSIYVSGYSATEFTEEDIAKYGAKGIKLSPTEGSHRVWLLKCEDDAERRVWVETFQQVCALAKPMTDADACIQAAFEAGFNGIKLVHNVFGNSFDIGPSADRLGDLVYTIIERDIVGGIINAMEDSPLKDMNIKGIRKAVQSTVRSVVSGAWISSVSAVRAMSSTLQKTVQDLITPLIEQQHKLKEAIVEKVGESINTAVSGKSEAIKPALALLCKPIQEAFHDAAKDFFTFMSSKIDEDIEVFSAGRREESVVALDKELGDEKGPLKSAFDKVHFLNHNLNVGGKLPLPITLKDIHSSVLQNLKMIVHRAIITWSNLIAASTGPRDANELKAQLLYVQALLIRDCHSLANSIVQDVVVSALNAVLQEALIPLTSQLQPIQDMIAAIPIPGMSNLFDLTQLFNDTVDDIESSAVTSLLSNYVEDSKSAFQTLAASQGITSEQQWE